VGGGEVEESVSPQMMLFRLITMDILLLLLYCIINFEFKIAAVEGALNIDSTVQFCSRVVTTVDGFASGEVPGPQYITLYHPHPQPATSFTPHHPGPTETISIHRLTARLFTAVSSFVRIMLLKISAYGWASAEDIPGSRCGPEDGPWPRPYQILNEPELQHELRRRAKPQTFVLGDGGVSLSSLEREQMSMRVDCVNFQPSFKARTQDRYVVKELEIRGRMWGLTGVFDGECSVLLSANRVAWST